MEIIWYLIVYIVGVFVSAQACKDFLFKDEYEIYTNNKKWVVSLVVTLLSFAGILLFFIVAILVYLYKESPTLKYKNWPLYKILFRK